MVAGAPGAAVLGALAEFGAAAECIPQCFAAGHSCVRMSMWFHRVQALDSSVEGNKGNVTSSLETLDWSLS